MPITNAGPPPATKTTPKPTAPKTAKDSALNAARTDALNGFGQLAQVPLIATKMYADAGAVGQYWPKIAKEIANLADSQDQIAKLIDPLIQVGPYTGLITAVLPFVLQIGVNHGRVSAGAMGTVPKETLSSQVETALAQAQLEALKTQRDAENAARAMRQEIASARADAESAANDF
jgi:hypothetical protein